VPLLPAQDPTLNLNASAQSGLHQVAAGSFNGGQMNAGSIDSDDFNRASLGAGWSQQSAASFAITSNTLTSASGNDWILRAGTTAAYQDQTTEFDLLGPPPSLSYVAAVMGVGSDQLYTKVQSNSGGAYDYIGFYHGFNGSGLGSYGGFFAITPVSGGRVRISVSNAGDTMNVDIDEGFDGVYEYHYDSSGIIANFSGTLGTGVGIGGWAASCDNWDLGDGPSGPTLAISGSCPGLKTFDVAGATPFGAVAVLYGAAGSFTKPHGACSGLTLGISSPNLAGIFGASAAGTLSFAANVPGGACGLTVQAVDVSTCTATNTHTL
jgi:hypothetical protein